MITNTTINIAAVARKQQTLCEAMDVARADLAAAATSVSVASLAEKMEAIARLEGQLTAYALTTRAYDYAVHNGIDPVLYVNHRMTTRLLDGADDSWSGRGNDVKRIVHDGFRAAMTEILGG